MNCDMYSFITVILAGKWQTIELFHHRAISSSRPRMVYCSTQAGAAISQMQQLSSYAATLGSEALKRYKEKLVV